MLGHPLAATFADDECLGHLAEYSLFSIVQRMKWVTSGEVCHCAFAAYFDLHMNGTFLATFAILPGCVMSSCPRYVQLLIFF